MNKPWFVVVERTALDDTPMLPYVVGPYPSEDVAAEEAQSESSIPYSLLTIDAKNEGYVATECSWTDDPPNGERIIPNLDTKYVLHFGLYPEDWQQSDDVEIDGWTDASKEHMFALDFFGNSRPSVPAIVSGSWGCWGPADQDTDGDNSLHVLVYVDEIDPDHVEAIRDALHMAGGADFMGSSESNFRILDYALVSSPDDWSEKEYVVAGGHVGKVNW